MHQALVGCLAISTLLATTGCGPSFGAFLYTIGTVPKQKVKAAYELPKGPMLILVDDDQDLVQPPTAKRALVDQLSKLLRDKKVAERITTSDEIARLRQAEPKFDTRGAREVGRMAHADTVIWLSVKEFTLDTNIELTATPAQFSVILKIVNAKAEKKEDVRLWPPEREGRLIAVTVTPHDLHTCKTLDEVHELIAGKMAEELIKLFKDYEVDQDSPGA